MPHPAHSSLRRLLVSLCALVLSSALVAPAAPAQARPGHRYPSVIDLPDGWRPEGIAIGRRPVAYVGSLADGAIYRISLRSGAGRVLSEGTGTPAVGLAVDRHARLFVAGGPSGTARVVDTRSGETRADYVLSSGSTFVNDVVLTGRSAWFTDSQQAQLYRLPLGRRGALPEPSEVQTLPLTGEWQQVEGFNANGIEQTPDRRALLVVNSTVGALFRVDPRTGAATEVAVAGLDEQALTNGDGLLLHGRTLYVVQNRLNRVAVLRLSADGSRGRVRGYLTSDDFDVPTTAARFGHRLYLPNARFTTEPTPDTEYTVVSVRAGGRHR